MMLIGIGIAALAIVFVWWQIRDGYREMYWETEEQRQARYWENLVWSHSSWLNHRGDRLETPDEGLERLSPRRKQ